MPINRLYDTWKTRITELRPGQRITQIRAFAWLLVGIYLSRSVCLSQVAGKIPGEAKLTSATRRLRRLTVRWLNEKDNHGETTKRNQG